jgi:hypothetical protein
VNDWHQSSVFLAYLTGDQTNLNNNQTVTSTVPLSILDPVVVRAKKRLYDKLLTFLESQLLKPLYPPDKPNPSILPKNPR